MMRAIPAALAAWLTFATTTVHATEPAIDPGWVVANGEIVDSFATVDSLGVAWVRINFRLDAWSSVDDATPHGSEGLTWFQAYDRVIDEYVARGYQVYGLINDEAVDSPHPHGSDAWIGDYVATAVKIVDHFKDRVRVYEVINEPNDWAGGTTARFTPRAFAKILQDTYLAVKHHDGHIDERCWQVDLVSGPLFSFDGNSSADYLAQTYAIGRNELAWDWTKANAGSFPLDGIGYHLYVAQGPESSLADVRASMHANLDEVWNVVVANEGAATGKQFWISEYGFQAKLVGDDGQAARLEAGFNALRDYGNVALGVFFTLNDFGGLGWGVISETGQRRPAADRLATVASANRPARGALVKSIIAPALAPGEIGEVVITLENRGAQAWSGDVRLGAAPGCPDAAAANEIVWEPANGYANGPGDARVFLAEDVAPGATVELRVPVRAPETPGVYRFAARMVDEGVAWFGSTAQAFVTVAPLTGEDPMPGDPDASAGGAGGCAAGGSASGCAAFLVVAALARIRRRDRGAR